MDAKPHRPTRPFAAQASRKENLPLTSSVSISKQSDAQAVYHAQVNVGGFKAATKRHAFGDVSNTSHYAHHHVPVNDMAKHAILANHVPASKPASKMAPPRKQDDKENVSLAVKNGKTKAAFLQPPQRPVNGARAVSTDYRAQPVVKQTGVKKISNVYNDVQQQKAQTLSRKYASQPLLKNSEVPVVRRSQSKGFLQGIKFENTIDGNVTETQYDLVKEGSSRPAFETSAGWMNVPRPAGARINPSPPNLLQESLEQHNEAYDEDDDEEQYEEAGYTTVHSYKSYADTTTGATTLLVPKRTFKVEWELEDARLHVEKTRPAEEIDDEEWDITMVAEYGEEIFAYMRELEERMIPNVNYMNDFQVDITWSMRSVLMDWVVQVHSRFTLLPETLFLIVNIIDRFLSKKVISLGKLQLVGATAILIAAKYEEINCPSIGEIVFMVDAGYSADEILKAERFMLTMIDFELGWPGPMSFLRRISKADDYDLETRTLAKYFLDVTVMDERFVGCTGSYIAAGAHGLARTILKKGEWVSHDPVFGDTLDNQKLKSLWTPAHVHYSGYTWAQIKPLIAMILECCQMADQHHRAIFDKYTDRRFKKASIYVQEELAKGFRLPFQNAIPRLSLCEPEREHTAQIRFPPVFDSSGFVISVQS